MVNQGVPQTTAYMGIRLTVQSEDPQDRYYHPQDFFPLAKEGGVLIGRAASNDIQLEGNGVSNIHCRVAVSGTDYVVEDAGSSNGTFVGYRQLQPGERHPLKDGDVIRVVHYSVTFRMGLSAFSPQPQEDLDLDSTLQVEHAMVQQFLSEPEEHSPQITFMNGSHPGLVFTLNEYEDCTVGRDPNCALCLPEDAVSRQHALIRRDWSGVTLRDLNSANGVYVNGIRIQPNTEVGLNNGDQIGIGHYMLKFSDPFAASLEDKLKGVWVEDDLDNTMSGATLIGANRKGKDEEPSKKQEPTDQDVREPVSGQWRAGRASAGEEEKPNRRSRRRRSQEESSTPKPSAKHPSEVAKEKEAEALENKADKGQASEQSPMEEKKKSRQERRRARRQKMEQEARDAGELDDSSDDDSDKSGSKKEGGSGRKASGVSKGGEKSQGTSGEGEGGVSTPIHRGKSRLNRAEKTALGLVVGLVFILVVLVLVLLFLV
ncbi:MAG: FHA domain-containing protein [Deltaproteobacteria bacterium]|nr:MAG: FHA domain-containing protein [Deltaproteobacteria bacterium]